MSRLALDTYRTVAGKYYGTPKEVWGFRTPAQARGAVAVARRFLRANHALLGLRKDLGNLCRVRTVTRDGKRRRQRDRPRVVRSIAATHVIFQQYHRNLRVHRAYVTVHVDLEGRVYLAKNRAMPEAMLPRLRRAKVDLGSAKKLALRTIQNSPKDVSLIGKVERMWFPVAAELRLAYRVRLHRGSPPEEWIVYVDALTGEILSRCNNLAAAVGRARVFDPNPIALLGGHEELVAPDGSPIRHPPAGAYKTVRLRDLDGSGYLDGKRVTTSLTANRVKKPDHRYMLRATQKGFEEVMVYYHLDRVIGYIERLGYTGAKAIFKEPVRVNVRGTYDDASWYSSGLKQLTFGTGGVDDAEDAETIVHEFGHALQDAITPDFGQSSQAAAMGEGFGDYLAASFFADKKPAAYRESVMCWDAIQWDTGYDPPCLRRVDEPYTFEDFDPVGTEHDNGLIWSATLWDIREAIGRRRSDRIIIESHFQLDGFTSFAKGARAILDANANLYDNRYRSELENVFHRRGIGPVV